MGDDSSEEPEQHTADALILATGAKARRLGLEGEERYWGNGVSACAVCDGSLPIFRAKPLVVIGGGDSAVEEALYLTKKAERVTVLVRKDFLRASKVNARRLSTHPKVEIRYNTVGVEITGEDKERGLMTGLRIKNVKTGKEESLVANGLFYAVGHDPATALFKGQLDTDEDGYLIAGPDTKTSVEGVFAAGDVQDKKYRQAITSAGTGCVAALEAEKFLAEHEPDVPNGVEADGGAKKPGNSDAPEYRSIRVGDAVLELLNLGPGVLGADGDSEDVLVAVEDGVDDGGKGGVIGGEGDGGDGGNGAGEGLEQLALLNVEHARLKGLALVVDLRDGHTVGEGRDVEHVEQGGLGGSDLAAGLDELKLGRDFNGTTGNLGGNTESLEERGLAGLHASVAGRDEDIAGGDGTGTGGRSDAVGQDLLADLLELAVGEDEADVALDVRKKRSVLGGVTDEALESTADLIFELVEALLLSVQGIARGSLSHRVASKSRVVPWCSCPSERHPRHGESGGSRASAAS
ncbi:hypothetical protein FH972_025783 [Carpinus fangiana]|uniref:FAD/NAD(P)-binding domain-containing protein n=1 Tax=Carpinus fangiana TaxID=176857 RepID=A0A5N6L2L2_9ROSI|nr:hypothetical protein FH972_025783 [Carpinus fangiana]